MRERRGFTVLELLAAISIIVILASLTAPVFSAAKRKADETHSVGNLRQQFLAIKMYQIDWDGDGVYGDRFEMGLPPLESEDYRKRYPDILGQPIALWKSRCAPHPSIGRIRVEYFQFFPWEASTGRRFQDNMILSGDLNCNDPDVPVFSSYSTKKGLGVLLGGSLVSRIRTGMWLNYEWWADPVEK